MLSPEDLENKDCRDDFIEELNKRKNLMIYEGIGDGLEEGVKKKYCYSSPYDPLEFIIIDIYNRTIIKNIYNKKVEIYGIMSIIKEEEKYLRNEYESIYGNITISDIYIRNIKKNEVILNINRVGIQDLRSVVLYFEDYFCKKMQS